MELKLACELMISELAHDLFSESVCEEHWLVVA